MCLSSPGKKRPRIKPSVLHIDDFDEGVLRRKIHRFHFEREILTMEKIWRFAQNELCYAGSKESLRKVVNKIGFKYKKKLKIAGF